MTSRERLRRILRGEPVDRVGKAEAPWPQTRARWRREGLPEDVHPNDFFRMDVRRMIQLDASFRMPASVQEDEKDFVVARNADGVLERRWKDERGPGQTIEYSVRSSEDWARLRERLAPDDGRYSFGYFGDYGFEYRSFPLGALYDEVTCDASAACTCLLFGVNEPYEAMLPRVGDETLLVWMASEPGLISDMFAAHTELVIRSADRLLAAGVKPDAVMVGGDIAYRNGLLFSPAMYRELLMPHHARLFRFLHEQGLPVIYHSDGRVIEALPMLLEAGIDCLHPLEVQAGMDLEALAPEFGGRVSFMGNVSPRELSGSRDRAVAEARRRIRAGKKTRGYIFQSDHSLPPTVPWDNYCAVMEVFDEEAPFGA